MASTRILSIIGRKNAGKTTLTVALKSELKNPPAAPGDQVPLLQMLPEGEVVYDLRAGRLQRANLRIEKELPNHQGEGSSYRFVSSYFEEYVGDK